jgi:hypothetical protein
MEESLTWLSDYSPSKTGYRIYEKWARVKHPTVSVSRWGHTPVEKDAKKEPAGFVES